MSTTSTPPETFSPNERVLCYHGPLVYEAKILKAEHWDESNTKTGGVGPHYFVHYKGWKQTYVAISSNTSILLTRTVRWDEWVYHKRLLKHNEENLTLQRTLQQANAAHNAAQISASSGAALHGKGMGYVSSLADWNALSHRY